MLGESLRNSSNPDGLYEGYRNLTHFRIPQLYSGTQNWNDTSRNRLKNVTRTSCVVPTMCDKSPLGVEMARGPPVLPPSSFPFYKLNKKA
ncbi:hypothetical protein GWI33_018117 [Rhynchophorus ferrugineus]|uniref:Uncharacterized protein n=1 Tax=Rhynchophorus ferrugineus TaxID=354439 RepID=A0A834I7W9_RHYFE|nr:hypothetical protein GWI33_018117 [Rhynchophorus ferrugineus]